MEEKIEKFKKRCWELNLAVTIQRLAIYSYLIQTTSHPTANQVYDQVKEKFPGLARASVHRILETFVQYGIIQKLVHSGTSVRYDGNPERHCHIICRKCGLIFDIDPMVTLPEFNFDFSCRLGDFEVDNYSIIFTGTCPECRIHEEQEEHEESKK